MDPIVEIAATAPAFRSIEDAAQAIGASYRRPTRPAASARSGASRSSRARTSARSATPGSSPPTTTRWRSRVRLLRNHGAERQYHHRLVGGNFRLDALQAAVLRVKPPHLAAWTAARRATPRATASCSTTPGSTGRVDAAGRGARAHAHLQPVRHPRAATRSREGRPRRRAASARAIYYPVPFHLQECFAYLGYRAGAFPASGARGAGVAGAADLRRAVGGSAAARGRQPGRLVGDMRAATRSIRSGVGSRRTRAARPSGRLSDARAASRSPSRRPNVARAVADDADLHRPRRRHR